MLRLFGGDALQSLVSVGGTHLWITHPYSRQESQPMVTSWWFAAWWLTFCQGSPMISQPNQPANDHPTRHQLNICRNHIKKKSGWRSRSIGSFERRFEQIPGSPSPTKPWPLVVGNPLQWIILRDHSLFCLGLPGQKSLILNILRLLLTVLRSGKLSSWGG